MLLTIGGKMLQRAHVVEPVGKLDEDDSNVVRHSQYHLADVFRLPFFPACQIDLRDLGDAVDDVGYRRAELFLDLVIRDIGIFHCVVQQSGGDCRRIQFHLCQDERYFEGMN